MAGRWLGDSACFLYLGAVLAALLGTSCGGGPPPPMELSGRIEVGEGVNPDASGRPSPLFLRLYQLRSPGALLGASFQELNRDDSEVLAADLLKRDIWEFCPAADGQAETPEPPTESLCHSRDVPIKITLMPDARYLGVVAEFYNIRDPHGRWREVREIPPPVGRFLRSDRAPVVLIELEQTTVSLTFE